MTSTIRLGRHQDVLASVECDALICDPPYGARVHREALGEADDREQIDYSHWDPDDVREFVQSWSPRTRGWMACLTSHDLIPAWEEAYAEVGRCGFAPVSCVITGMGVRMAGDGPSSWTVYLMVARPRTAEMARWGALPGAYVVPRPYRFGGGGRGKPLRLMEAIVRDYSRRGDLVCDPCAGWGHTLIAARSLGRRGVGAEIDAAAHAEACRRMGRAVQGDLLAGGQ